MSTERRRRIPTLSAAILAAQALALTAVAQTPQTDTSRPGTGSMPSSSPSTTDRGTMHQDAGQSGSMDKSGKGMKPVTAQSFASQAATINKAEIELGQLAMTNSKDASVRKYAARMVKDHTATAAKLKTIAAKENIALPQTLDAEHAAVKTKLSGLQGEDFDREYTKEMAKGHDKALALFESASQTPQISGDLKEFAAATLPALREHQEMAHDLRGKEGA